MTKTNRLPVRDMRLALTRLRDESAVAALDLARVGHVIEAMEESGGDRLSLDRALNAAFGPEGSVSSDRMTAFRNLRWRVNKAASDRGVDFALVVDTAKQSAPSERWIWAEGGSGTEAAAEKQMAAATAGGALRAPQGAVLVSRGDADERREVRFFVVWAEEDLKYRDDLLNRLEDELALATNKFRFISWGSKEQLVVGDRFHERIVEAIDACHVGLLLLSRGFLSSRYIRDVELPNFVSPTGTTIEPKKKCFPVALKHVDPKWEGLGGLKERQIFWWRNRQGVPSYFSQLKDDGRDRFVNALAEQMVRATERIFESDAREANQPLQSLDELDLAEEGSVAYWNTNGEATAHQLAAAFDGSRRGYGVDPQRATQVARSRARRTSLRGEAQPDNDARVSDDQGVDALGELIAWTESSHGPLFCAVLGEVGIGKTTTLQCLTRTLLETRSESGRDAARLPLFIDLRLTSTTARKEPTLERILDSVLRQTAASARGEGVTASEAIRLVQEEGALILFDGLDEVLVHLSPIEGQQFTRQLMEIIPSALRRRHRERGDDARRVGRVVVSCRTHYFRDVADQFAHLAGQRDRASDDEIRALLLLPFGEEQIREFLRLNAPERNADAFFELIESVHNLTELAKRPYTLRFILDQAESLERMRMKGERVNGTTLYRLMVSEWLGRDHGKHTWVPDHKRLLMQYFAAALWRSGDKSWSALALDQWMVDVLSARPDIAAHYKDSNLEILKEDLRTATFLVRDGDRFRFAHSSLQEYFLAGWLWDAALADRPDEWAIEVPSVETMGFLAQTLEVAPEKEVERAHRSWKAWRAEYRAQTSENLLAFALTCHARDIRGPVIARIVLDGSDLRDVLTRFGGGAPGDGGKMNLRAASLRETRWENAEVSGLDLSSAKMVGAHLDRACLTDCLLTNADLTSASLVGASFRGCSIRGASFDGAAWRRTQFVASPLIGARGIPSPDALVEAPDVITDAGPLETTVYTELRPVVRGGHSGWVNCVAFRPEGQLASGGSDGTVRLWDTDTGKCIAVLTGHTDSVESVAFGPNGHLASSGYDGTVRLWDIKSGECAATLTGHIGGVICVAFGPNGRLASGGDDETVRLWDTKTGECTATLNGHTDGVLCVAFGPNGQLASGGHDETVRLWDTETRVCTATLRGHTGSVSSLAFGSGAQLASGGFDETARLWDTETDECIATLNGHTSSVLSVAFKPDGQLASGGEDHTVRLWDTDTGECTATLRGHRQTVLSVAFGPEGRLASGGYDCTVRLWDTESGECIATLAERGIRMLGAAFGSHGRLAIGGSDGTIRLLDSASGECTATLKGHTSTVSSIAFRGDGWLAAGGHDGTVRVWDTATGKCTATLKGHTIAVSSVAFGCGAMLASGGYDDTVRIWNTETGECIATLSEHTDSVSSVAFGPDGFLASGGFHGTVRLWDTATGECTATLKGHTHAVRTVAFRCDGHLASGGHDGTVRIWDIATGNCTTSLTGSTSSVLSVAFGPGAMLASGGYDGIVRIWDTATGECTATLRGHSGAVRSVAFGPCGRLASAGYDGTVRLWDTNTGECEWVLVFSGNGEALLRARAGTGSFVVTRLEGDAWRRVVTEVRLEDGRRLTWPAEVLLNR